MSILQIELPDEELQLINEQARAQGFENGGAYLVSLAQQLAHQKETPGAEQSAREERLLLQVANSPRTESTPELWAQLRAELEAKIGEKV